MWSNWQQNMKSFILRGAGLVVASLALAFFTPTPALATGTLSWNAEKEKVSADLKSEELLNVLEKVAASTHWHIYVEPDALHPVSAKFRDLEPGEALHLLLGNLSFALVPQTNAESRLYVFRTSRQNATRLVRPAAAGKTGSEAKRIPNELIVRLKPGVKIEDIARLIGAKVIGRIDGLNAYRLQFDDQAATEAARAQLATNPDVTSVDNNYSIDKPPSGGQILPTTAAGPQITLDPPSDNCATIVGIVDTDIQKLGNNLDQFLTKQTSVAGQATPDTTTPSHGTSMLETMVRSLQAATKGHTSVRAVAADVYGPNATTTTFDVAQGIGDVINDGAKIVNLSLGSDADSSFLHTVIQDAASKNIVFIGAAGNSPVTTPFYPAAYPEVNAVTAIDNGQLASYANRGSFITLGAPGTSVVDFGNQAWSVAGTSASAAYTSGIAAAYLEANPCSSPSSIQSYLRSNLGVKITTTGQ